ncbi:DUF885 domain-containing protein [Parerythrobacter jejuensis]|uniref:DUF885 family protein n=1 Tax=Parerythrobacter jejuensis TaxID=795812 RepID=A0A845AP97_9SPHN|nr:DUF885 domain-containing protein [Parerythrobacter jejuensis]MXP30691.1 DUF885 family protein [Parerythrobacter jejuensis]MXP33451.1 DUF885 family protein [Parerythrobacter jejuensis]
MTRILAILLASTAVASCGQMGAPVATFDCAAESETECINLWFDSKFEEELAFSPLRQTALGLKTDYDKIDDMSVAAEQEQLEWWQATAAEMEGNFDYDALSDDAKLSWDMWMFRKEQAEKAAEFRDQGYILHQMNGTHTALPSFLISQHKVESEADMKAFIRRVSGIGTAMDQLLERAQNNAEAGTRPPRFSYDAVIAESKKITSGAPFAEGDASALWEASEGHLAKLVADGTITAERAGELREEARAAFVDDMAPAYARVVTWFEEDLPNTDQEAQGVSALANGADFYNYRLNAMTTTDLTAEEIHQIGLDEVARIREEMVAIKDQVGFEGDLNAFFTFMREDDQFYFPDNDAGAQMYIDQAKEHLAFIDTRLPDFFGILPKAPLEVRRVEPFREQDGAAQHYRPGTPDGSRPGIYYAHLSDMRAMSIPALEVIAYHEGNPGHHMQLSIAQELTGIPKFRAQGGYIPAFGEGWGLYSEKLAKEMGAYEDPYSDFGRLTTEIWRAIRLVVDTGLHSKGWTEQQAIDYFLANSPIPEAAVKSEVRRYIVMPGQATAYKIGMIRIQELRAKAEQDLGEDFDIRGFHDTVLGGGPVPLNILERRVDQWIESVKAA